MRRHRCEEYGVEVGVTGPAVGRFSQGEFTTEVRCDLCGRLVRRYQDRLL